MLNKISGATPANSPQISQNQTAVRFTLEGTSSSISGKKESCLSHIFGFIAYLWKSFVAFLCCGKKEQTNKTEESEKKTKKKHVEDFELEKPQTEQEKVITKLEGRLREHLDAFEELNAKLAQLISPVEGSPVVIGENETEESIRKEIANAETLAKKTRVELGVAHAEAKTVDTVTASLKDGLMTFDSVSAFQARVSKLSQAVSDGDQDQAEEFYLALSQLKALVVLQKTTLKDERVKTVLELSKRHQSHPGMEQKIKELNAALKEFKKAAVINAFNALETLAKNADKNESAKEDNSEDELGEGHPYIQIDENDLKNLLSTVSQEEKKLVDRIDNLRSFLEHVDKENRDEIEKISKEILNLEAQLEEYQKGRQFLKQAFVSDSN